MRRLQRDFRDARLSSSGLLLPRIPYRERTWVRLRAEAAFRSEPVRRARAAIGDTLAHARRSHDPELPPRRLQVWVGDGDYRAKGVEFRHHFIELGGLRAHHDVLDVGSGSGRMAFALKGWLTGRYEGFDVLAAGVEWCRRSISSRHPNFNFSVADVHSKRYNPSGSVAPETYRFPYDDDAFDFAFLTSVFTHLQDAAVANYLTEVARVLRPGGTCFATYFLINDEAVRLIGGHGQFGFDRGTHLVVDELVPERAVAFRESFVREVHDRAGLPIQAVYPGSWCGRTRYTSLQDITVSVKR